MSQEVRGLEPKNLWNKFADLNAVPRPSKKEERVIEFMMNFGKSLGLETIKDEVGNVIIKKPATKGLENRKVVVMQSHLDMVHQKNNDTVFDFDTQGIDMYVEDGWVRARGTTLGADNGLGVAAIMAILESNEIPHPAIEALFTIDEETGMTGAKGLQGGMLEGEILLNLDTEEDDEIDIGCAGGVDVTASAEYDEEDTPEGSIGYRITVKGLNGGHSGMDIHKGLGNANKIMNRLLFDAFDNFGLQISKIKGGSLRNAIPRESVAEVIIANTFDEAFVFDMTSIVDEIKAELHTVDPNFEVVFEKLEAADTPKKVMPSMAQYFFVRSMYTAHNGVFRMSPDFDDLVEASNNIAKVDLGEGKLVVKCLTRSSVESSKFDVANSLRSAFELMGCEVEFSGSYPGWTPNSESEILDVLVDIYEKQVGEKPNVVACHAGLECGILGTNYPDMDMISFGPTIRGAHSPVERANIASVQKFWKFLLEILTQIPEKK
ncbi:aminoacyl-histidine dipeptidase [Myroides odoratimimus]|uniref:Aminoacyl-histidine dipeptidase n=2 Tax=Myroides odoratimimus TaxID=76832 RepID=A0ABP2NAC7_9FLAO|nr:MULTISPECIES: aminoacyl-histidine dipeptidase [Myroides]AJA69718.1 Xaa-His dipeptidase [Myroides sp. A21]APA93003.1 cytosol nonspecific dipeptidase [Myroides sp. ZB35]EHO08679.1 aminoacyl-histidine dipeptidase [Myroides odoratimimus CCUG 10230]EHO10563.1 aminoacyl-histidine dipeptidase [Myroides odoratimimus CCUG 12901]EHO12420.1 aminoacyl-histidine dipeptidase [Myroides odoratimimus CIP 101113]